MEKYFKKNSNIEIELGDKVAFVKQGEFNGLNIYTKIEGILTEDNAEDLAEMGHIDIKDVCEKKPCGCDFDIDKLKDIEDPLKELDNALAKLEKVVEILSKLTE